MSGGDGEKGGPEFDLAWLAGREIVNEDHRRDFASVHFTENITDHVGSPRGRGTDDQHDSGGLCLGALLEGSPNGAASMA
jgi:hypothetical protein